MSKMTIKVHEATSYSKALDDAMYNAFAMNIGLGNAVKLSGDCGSYDVTLYDLNGKVLDSETINDVLTAAQVFDGVTRVINRKTYLEKIPMSFNV